MYGPTPPNGVASERHKDMSATNDDDGIRERLERAFDGRATVRFAEAASLLRMTEKTLRRHVADGSISYRATGTGSLRMRREFAVSDLAGFYAVRKTIADAPPSPRGRSVPVHTRGLIGFLEAVGNKRAERNHAPRRDRRPS
jgi:hypothetical protein